MSLTHNVVAVAVAAVLAWPCHAGAAPPESSPRDPKVPTAVAAPADARGVSASDVSLPEATQPSVVSQTEESRGERGAVSIDPRLEPELRRNRAMVLGGTVMVATSVAAFVAMVVGLVLAHEAKDQLQYLDAPEDEPEARDKRKQRTAGNVTAIVGGAVSAVTLLAGIPLIAVGRRRQRELLRRSKTTLLPLRGGFGLSWRVRF